MTHGSDSAMLLKFDDMVQKLFLVVTATTIFYFSCHACCDTMPPAKKLIVPSALAIIAGGFDGFADYLQFHYDGSNSYWQPDISWRRKYRGGDPALGPKFFGSTTFLVWTTDGWHLMKFGQHMSLAALIPLVPGGRRKWWEYVVMGTGFWVLNRLGFSISYNLLKIK